MGKDPRMNKVYLLQRAKALGNKDQVAWDAIRGAVWSYQPIPDKPFKNISPYLIMKKAGQMDKHPLMSILIDESFWIRGELLDWIKSYAQREANKGDGWTLFRYHWKVIRSWIPLQMRLAAEQIFYDIGGEYRSLITGFRPLD